LAACAAPSAQRPADSLGEEHPLAGRIYDAGAQQFTQLGDVLRRVEAIRFLLLGEKHDNPLHHAGQALLLDAAASLHPSVVWEMISLDQSFQGPVIRNAESVASELDWANSGWPAFKIYRPVFEVSARNGLSNYAGNLGREGLMSAYRASLEGLESERAAALGVRVPLHGVDLAALRAEIERGHCGFGDGPMLDSMSAVQQTRDAFMAKQMMAHGSRSVLIAGKGHVGRERAVPYHLLQYDGVRPSDVLVVVFAEVDDDELDPAAYAHGADLVFFTPRISNEDPCDRFAEQVERIRAHEQSKGSQ
ncbi:MAG: ChaN family lipoprotein, partial [Myxococcota bacterium]